MYQSINENFNVIILILVIATFVIMCISLSKTKTLESEHHKENDIRKQLVVVELPVSAATGTYLKEWKQPAGSKILSIKLIALDEINVGSSVQPWVNLQNTKNGANKIVEAADIDAASEDLVAGEVNNLTLVSHSPLVTKEERSLYFGLEVDQTQNANKEYVAFEVEYQPFFFTECFCYGTRGLCGFPHYDCRTWAGPI